MWHNKKVKFSHTCYQALGPELIPVYMQSAGLQVTKLSPGGRLPLLSARPAFYLRKHSPDGATPNLGNRRLITAYYSSIDPQGMKGWVGLVGWPIADGLPTQVVTHQLQVERRTGKVRRPETDVLPLSHAANCDIIWSQNVKIPPQTTRANGSGMSQGIPVSISTSNKGVMWLAPCRAAFDSLLCRYPSQSWVDWWTPEIASLYLDLN